MTPSKEVVLLQQNEDLDQNKTIQMLNNRLAAQDKIIQRQQAELIAKENVIQRLNRFRKTSVLYWMVYWLPHQIIQTFPLRWLICKLYQGQDQAIAPTGLIRHQIRQIQRKFAPKLGNLCHHSPIPLQIPAWYTNQAPPNPAPGISIITPSFNQAAFLERTIQSVLNQDYPALEYIIQDGGSTDETAAILKQYCTQLTHCESKPDKGQAQAINRGIIHTTGEIMAWLNSDDMLLTGTLNVIANYFTHHPDVDVVYGHRVLIDEQDQEIGRWVLPPHDDRALKWADYIPQETLFWRRRIWEKSGGYVDERFRFGLDWELLLRFQKAGAIMARLPRFLGAFRVHKAQKTSTQLSDTGMAEMNRLRERCHGQPVSEAEIWRRIKPYLGRSVIYHKLYRLGLLRY